MESRFKIFSDPVHGFISVPKNLILELIESPEVQRLRRIRQLGVGHLVFPGAEHSRFGHALGAMALMQEALATISEKGTPISPDEHTAALAAALLHDIGHGPYSHTLEHDLLAGVHHEKMSRALLVQINERFGGALDLALQIFDGTYERPFFHELVSSQLDMDRLDYLRRDSFYTGVVEGEVGVERLLKTLRVEPVEGGSSSRVVVESKGVYAVENFLISRRLMYWQVYLHKTVLAGDHVLRAALRRVREHVRGGMVGIEDTCASSLLFFLKREVSPDDLHDPEVRAAFCDLDDSDVLVSLKKWMKSSDPILADLARRFILRDFPAVTFISAVPNEATQATWRDAIAEWLPRNGLSTSEEAARESAYYLSFGRSLNATYTRAAKSIVIRERDGTLREYSETSDFAAVAALAQPVVKPYVCHPKGVHVKEA